jgi:hypothetical protein
MFPRVVRLSTFELTKCVRQGGKHQTGEELREIDQLVINNMIDKVLGKLLKMKKDF